MVLWHRRLSALCITCCFIVSLTVCFSIFTLVGAPFAFMDDRVAVTDVPALSPSVHLLPAASVPVGEATIFVSIAAYRDRECVTTLESLFTRASNPRRVFVGLSEERFAFDSNCVDSAVLRDVLGTSRTRVLRWRDIVPSAFSETYGIGSNLTLLPTVATPLLHLGREEDELRCLLLGKVPNAQSQAGVSPLTGCQIITRVGKPTDARGPTYGRYLTSLLYNNQDYYMVLDSHSRFIPQWDMEMIQREKLMPTRGVLSHYPNGYTPQAPDAERNKKDVMCMCKGVVLDNHIPKLGARWTPLKKKPILQGFVAAGYIFGDAQFVKDVPFDPYLPYLFDGEEILYTARLWTHGWDSYCPGMALVYHNYERKDAPRFFVNVRGMALFLRHLSELRVVYLLERRKLRTSTLLISEDEAHIQKPLVGHNKSRFGVGSLRSLNDYWKFVQLSDEFVKEKDNENRWMGGEGLCEMHRYV